MSGSFSRLLRQPRTWILAAVGLVVLVFAARFAIHAIQGDPPDRLTLDDAPAASTTTAGASATSTSAAGSGAPIPTDGVEGVWKIGDGSQAGYRVPESLFGEDAEAVGRTSDVTGTMTVAGTSVTAADITVDMTTVASDRSQRDGQFRGRIMSTSEFPTATFVLTKPIALDSVPTDGVEVSATATGDLTLRGVTRSVTFTLAAKRTGATIAVNGTIPVDFDAFSIPNASGGPASVGRNGEVELLLVFTR